MFTVAQRASIRDHVLELAEKDERVLAGAVVGSLAAEGGGDQFSDLDLTFGISEHAQVVGVLDEWASALAEGLDAVQLVQLEREPTTYRVFLLPGLLQLDLSMTPAAQFRPAGPRFRLLFGKTAPIASTTPGRQVFGDLFIATPAIASDIFGWGSSTRCTRMCASSAGVSGRRSTTPALCGTMVSHLHACPGA
jgi:hypothetical protein